MIAILALLVAPLVVIVPISLSSGSVLSLHLPGLSLRWFADFAANPRWVLATRNSFLLGLSAAGLSTLFGGLAAWGLWRGGAPGWVLALLHLPLFVPTVIAGLAMFFGAASVGLAGSFAGLLLGHTVLTLPYATLALLAALRRFDAGLLRAAASLGADRRTTLLRVVLPQLGQAAGGAALLAFAFSFDELIVALFLAGPSQYTLPRQMLAGISDVLTPTICAAAVVVSVVSIAAMAAATGLQRRYREEP